ncbi:MAG: hypothetical protein ABWZ80_10175 [Beijerinckiaceae bacterium]
MSVVRRGPTAPLAAVLSVLAFPALSQPAATAASQGAFTGPITIKDVKVQFFFEKSATFSENIADFPAPIVNAQRGEGAPEPASGVLVTMEVVGPKGGQSNDKIALHMAQVNITRKYKSGPRLEQRVFGGFRFNDKGSSYKAFMIDAATCAPLEIEAKLGRSRKFVKVDFECTPELASQ